nr:immunoglobulin light chain junction region [Macaca mulatta]MOW27623.1 immunoglobulin light chain junction region [Macaca mulatta]MOW28699.1 immunoglobulin light chain junction region [Macaca mulatta]MOW29638.1 immunoglobulin light chain junction region [Macaca mulatta]MOW29851.1 immunoglobulin light chain junction region [Macaca mulatta]
DYHCTVYMGSGVWMF